MGDELRPADKRKSEVVNTSPDWSQVKLMTALKCNTVWPCPFTNSEPHITRKRDPNLSLQSN